MRRKKKSLKEFKAELRKARRELRSLKRLEVKVRQLASEKDRFSSNYYNECNRANEMAARLSLAEYFITEVQTRTPDLYEEICKHHADHRRPVVVMKVPKVGGVFDHVMYEPYVQWHNQDGEMLGKT